MYGCIQDVFAWMWECEGCVGERNDCPRKRGVKEGGSFSVRACTGFSILNSQSTGTNYLMLSPDALSLPMSMCLCPVLYLFLSISFSVSLFLCLAPSHTHHSYLYPIRFAARHVLVAPIPVMMIDPSLRVAVQKLRVHVPLS